VPKFAPPKFAPPRFQVDRPSHAGGIGRVDAPPRGPPKCTIRSLLDHTSTLLKQHDEKWQKKLEHVETKGGRGPEAPKLPTSFPEISNPQYPEPPPLPVKDNVKPDAGGDNSVGASFVAAQGSRGTTVVASKAPPTPLLPSPSSCSGPSPYSSHTSGHSSANGSPESVEDGNTGTGKSPYGDEKQQSNNSGNWRCVGKASSSTNSGRALLQEPEKRKRITSLPAFAAYSSPVSTDSTPSRRPQRSPLEDNKNETPVFISSDSDQDSNKKPQPKTTQIVGGFIDLRGTTLSRSRSRSREKEKRKGKKRKKSKKERRKRDRRRDHDDEEDSCSRSSRDRKARREENVKDEVVQEYDNGKDEVQEYDNDDGPINDAPASSSGISGSSGAIGGAAPETWSGRSSMPQQQRVRLVSAQTANVRNALNLGPPTPTYPSSGIPESKKAYDNSPFLFPGEEHVWYLPHTDVGLPDEVMTASPFEFVLDLRMKDVVRRSILKGPEGKRTFLDALENGDDVMVRGVVMQCQDADAQGMRQIVARLMAVEVDRLPRTCGQFTTDDQASCGRIYGHGIEVNKTNVGAHMRARPQMNASGRITLSFDDQTLSDWRGSVGVVRRQAEGDFPPMRGDIKFDNPKSMEWVCMALGITNLYATARPSAAVRKFSHSVGKERAQNQSRTWADTRVKQAIQFARKRDHKEAILHCDAALELNPKHVDGLVCKGASFGSMGQYKEALQCFDEALTLDPSHENGVKYRDTILLRQKKRDEEKKKKRLGMA